MKKQIIIMTMLSLLFADLPGLTNAQSGDRYNFYLNQFYTDVNLQITAPKLSKSDIERSLLSFRLWRNSVMAEDLLGRFTPQVLTAYSEIVNSVVALAQNIQTQCSFDPHLSKAFEIMDLIRWSRSQEEIIFSGEDYRIQSLSELVPECAKFQLTIQSSITGNLGVTTIVGTINAQINVTSEISGTYDSDLNLEFHGEGEISYSDIIIPPFSQRCDVDYTDTPSTVEALSVVTMRPNGFTEFEDIEIKLKPGRPIIEIITTCDGLTTPPLNFDVWEAIWKDLHTSERENDYFLIKNWDIVSPGSYVEKEYTNNKGDILEDTTIRVEF